MRFDSFSVILAVFTFSQESDVKVTFSQTGQNIGLYKGKLAIPAEMDPLLITKRGDPPKYMAFSSFWTWKGPYTLPFLVNLSLIWSKRA